MAGDEPRPRDQLFLAKMLVGTADCHAALGNPEAASAAIQNANQHLDACLSSDGLNVKDSNEAKDLISYLSRLTERLRTTEKASE